MNKINFYFLLITIIGGVTILLLANLLINESDHTASGAIAANPVYTHSEQTYTNTRNHDSYAASKTTYAQANTASYSSASSAQTSVLPTEVRLNTATKPSASNTKVVDNSSYQQVSHNAHSEQEAPVNYNAITPPISAPFMEQAPKVVAQSGDIAPFGVSGPRKAPPGTGDGTVNDNTGVMEDSPLNGGIWFLLLLALALAARIRLKKA